MPTPKEILAQNVSQSETSTGYIDTFDLFNVRRYGAVAGTSDSQGSAIDACINACISAGSKVVYFPTGVYMTTALSSNVDDVYLVGDNASFSSNGSTYTITQVFETTSIPALYADASSQATRISALESTVASHTTSIQGLYEATSSNAGRISALESTVNSLSSQITQLQTDTTNLRSDLNSHTTNSQQHLSVMTASGDMIYKSTGSTSARLPIGTQSQILTVSSDLIPKWEDLSSISTEFSGIERLIFFMA